MNKIDILILDDLVEVHPYYKSVLEPLPAIGRVTCCEDEIEFSQYLRKSTPHVIISDIHMEPKDGPQILRDNRDKLGDANIVLLSCADNIEAYAHALRLEGFNVVGHIQKPLKLNQLYDILGYGID